MINVKPVHNYSNIFKIRFKTGAALQQLLAFASLIGLIIFFSLASENFLQFSNIMGILLSTAVIGVLALGATFVIITAGIDLSVGTGMTLCSVMAGVFITFWGLATPLGVSGGIFTGTLMGCLIGLMVAKMKIPPFIATLAMMMIAERFVSRHFGHESDLFHRQAGILQNFPRYADSRGTDAVLIFFGAAVVAGLLLHKSVIGRYTYALGSNEEAAKLLFRCSR